MVNLALRLSPRMGGPRAFSLVKLIDYRCTPNYTLVKTTSSALSYRSSSKIDVDKMDYLASVGVELTTSDSLQITYLIGHEIPPLF